MIFTNLFLLTILGLVAFIDCAVPYTSFNASTGCPLGVSHVCEACTEDSNRFGCWCSDDEYVTKDIFTPCRTAIIDPCVGVICYNGGQCIREGLTQYRCNCTGRFGGLNCEKQLANCSSTTCKNSQCVETDSEQMPIYCQCYDGSKKLPSDNTSCPQNPCFTSDTSVPSCKNGGTCNIINNQFYCTCPERWTDPQCTTEITGDLCSSRPGICGQGVCKRKASPPKFSCDCGNYPSTFADTIDNLIKCENSPCHGVPSICQNNGICSNKRDGTFLCTCSPQFTGNKCEKQAACYVNQCLNGGSCESFNETVYYCTCPPYYTGTRCQIKLTDPCLGKDCGFGSCKDVNGVATCECTDKTNFDGTKCPDPCLDVNCGPGACVLQKNNTGVVCACPVNRTGLRCETPADICRERAVCGGGYCKPDYTLPKKYKCLCQGGVYSSNPCPRFKECPISTCGEYGICVETDGLVVPNLKPVNYVCSCRDGYIALTESCDVVLATVEQFKTSIRCGKGRPYPSRNPYAPIDCFCNNGTIIDVPAVAEPDRACL